MTLIEYIEITKQIIDLHQQVIDIKAEILSINLSTERNHCIQLAQAEAKFKLQQSLYNELNKSVVSYCKCLKTDKCAINFVAKLEQENNALDKDINFVKELFDERAKHLSKHTTILDDDFTNYNNRIRERFGLPVIVEGSQLKSSIT